MLLEMISNNKLIIPKVADITVLRYFEEIIIE